MAEPQNVLDTLTVKRNDNRPTLEMSIDDINEASDQPSGDAAWDGYDRKEFDEATRIELHMDYYDEDAEEFMRVVDGQEAQWDSSGDIVSVQLDREATDRAGEYYFEWVLIFDETPPEDSADAEEVNTVPSTGFYNLTVNDPTDRQLESAGAEDRTVGTLTIEGYLQDEDGNPPRLAGSVPEHDQHAVHKQHLDNELFPIEGDVESLENRTSGLSEDGSEADLESVRADEAGIDLHTDQRREVRTPFRTDGQYTYRGWQFDNFEDLTEWTAQEGTIEAETTEVWGGTQSMRWSGTGVNEAIVEITPETPVDLTQWCPSFSFKQKAPTDETIYVTVVGVDSEDNEVRGGRTTFPGDTSEDWRRVDAGFAETWGLVEPRDIETIQIKIQSLNSADFEFLIDDFRMVKRPEQGYVMFIFDDGFETHYTEGYRYLSKYNMVGAYGVHTDRVGVEDGYLTEDQMEEISSHGGEIISHNPTDTDRSSDLTLEEWHTALETTKRWLLERGYTNGARHHIYPSWRVDDGVLEATNQYHDTAYTAATMNMGAAVPLTPTSLLDIPRVHDQQWTLSSQKEFVDTLAEYGGVGVWAIHDIGSQNFTVEDWEELVDHIASKGSDIEVITPSDMLSTARSPAERDSQHSNADEWVFDGTAQTDSAADLTYTLRNDWDEVKVTFEHLGGDGGVETINMELNGNQDTRYYYRTIGSTINVHPDETKFLVGEGRGDFARGLSGTLELFSQRSGTDNGRVSVEGPVASGDGFADSETILTGVHRDETAINSLRFYTESGVNVSGRIRVEGRNSR